MSANEQERLINATERIGLVLASMYASQLGEIDQVTKVQKLNHCGFANTDIAKLLGMTPGAVKIALHRARKGKKSKKTK